MIERLVKLAKEEVIPEIDVSELVMHRISVANKGKDLTIKPMGIMAVVSAIAASIIIFFAVQSYQEMNDPMREFFEPVEVVSYMDFY